MKTKIIYISGNEVFDMAEIRAAFEEVRCALGLDDDTILFGVPVDKDNAIETGVETATSILNVNAESDESQEIINIVEEPIENTEFIIDETTTETISESEITDVSPEIIDNEQNVPDDTVIPILSVLSVKEDAEDTQEDHPVNEYENSEIVENAALDNEEIDQEPTVSGINIDSDVVMPASNTDVSPTTVSIADMINDDAPEKPVEKTLEHLLESMTPLREDIAPDFIDQDTIAKDDSFDVIDGSDTDATLAQLASEFVQTEDIIETPQKNESYGKIGKLKNILPFKKAKRDDGGLMGDLFGWAGIAANDDDFSIPGFFTKKQGA